MKFDVEDKIIVTGASSGIGEGVALLLNELGATVIGIGRNVERLNALKTKCKHPENMFLEAKELIEDIPSLPAYVKALKEKYGKFSGMAYCAGIAAITPLRAWEFDDAEKTFKVNYFAPVAMLKGFVDRRNNVGAGSAAVLISSASAMLADKGHCTYAATKAAVIASMRVIAKEYASLGLRVNCVSPSIIKTPMTMPDGSDYLESQNAKYPMGTGDVCDVSNLVAYLLSANAKWISAQNYIVDGASF